MTNEIIETAKATQEVAKATQKGLEVGEKVGGFFAKVLGEPIETAAGILGDKLKFMRWERQVRLVDRVEEINQKKGISGREVPVPPKLAIPIIENASLEENDFLQDLWVKLLSSSQGEDTSGSVRAAFIDIIKQLEVIDVKLLSLIFNSYSKAVSSNVITPNTSPTKVAFPKTEITKILGLNEKVYEDSVDNLMRVRCLCSEVKIIQGIGLGGENPTIDKGYESICITSLGVGFVLACIKD